MLYIDDVPYDIQHRVRKLAGIESYSTPFHTILCRMIYDVIGVSLMNKSFWHTMASKCEECLILADLFIDEGEEQ
jgi:hypothetical protein